MIDKNYTIKENRRILNIFLYPSTLTYTTATYPLCILSEAAKNNKWFYSNYVNISSAINPNNDYRVNFLSGDSFGGVEPLVYKKVLLSDEKNIFCQLSNLLYDGWYVFTFLDFAVLSLTPHKVHNILLYGIDNNSHDVYGLCYINGKLGKTTIDFDDFLKAYNSTNNTRKSLTRCMKPRNKEIGFSYEDFETQLFDYFYSDFSFNKIDRYYCNIDKIRTDEDELMEVFIVNSRKNGGYYYGFDCYESLKQYLKLDGAPEHIDIRPYRLIWEHKCIMKDRFVFFQKERIYPFDMSYYIKEMSKIEQSTRILFNLILKARIKKTFSIDHITDIIDTIKAGEQALLEKFISEIKTLKQYDS